MTTTDREALAALLAQMRTHYDSLSAHHAGVCVLHLEAAIAALESHLRRHDAPTIETAGASASASAMH